MRFNVHVIENQYASFSDIGWERSKSHTVSGNLITVINP